MPAQTIAAKDPAKVLIWSVEGSEIHYWMVPAESVMALPESSEVLADALGVDSVAPDGRTPLPPDAERDPAGIERRLRQALGRPRRRFDPAVPPTSPISPPQLQRRKGPDGPAAVATTAYAVAVEHPPSVPLGEAISLLVSITADLRSTSAIPFAGAVGEAIDVVVSPKRGFAVAGRSEARLFVGVGGPLPAQLRLTAVAEGVGEIICYAFRDGSPLGALTITPTVLPAGAAATTGLDTATGTLKPVPGAARADLELIVFAEVRDGEPVLRYRLHAPDPSLGLNLKEFGPVPLRGGPERYFASLFREISAIPVETANLRRIAAEKLTAIGSTLFEDLFPEELRVLLWSLQDRIGSVLIQSEEPWVPWELCRLVGRQDGRVVEGKFFCEAFEVTRWLLGTPRKPGLAASAIGVIQPPSDLASAPAEAAMLQRLATPGPPPRTVTVIQPTYTEVRKALGEGGYEVVHFTGHGRFPDADNPESAELSLAGTQTLHPTDISGTVTNLGLRSPLVFLNACQSGVKGVDLTGNGGWAVAMLEAGAGAFIGSHWDVTDSLALDFSTTFYARLVAGDTVPAAVRAARLSIHDDGDPTWLAYSCYADPRARLT